jgi:hypothetical protein
LPSRLPQRTWLVSIFTVQEHRALAFGEMRDDWGQNGEQLKGVLDVLGFWAMGHGPRRQKTCYPLTLTHLRRQSTRAVQGRACRVNRAGC